MPDDAGVNDDRVPRAGVVDRRALMRLGVAGGALVAVPALLARAAWSGTRSPFDAPFGITQGRNDRAAGRRVLPPPATIVSRAQWKADERIRSRAIDFDATVEKIVVHHTGTSSSEPDWPREVRAIYRSTVARGYRDVPYHWLIDPNGLVYEGRWARRVTAGAFPTGEDARGRSVRGGHAKSYNERTIGVALLGTFDDHRPTDAAFDALIAVIAWKCSRWKIDPVGATPYRLNDGTRQVVPNICPHRRVRATACPGRVVTDLLPELRLAVQQRLS
jgi:N-acetylmuramoyl-L-alanine amidase